MKFPPKLQVCLIFLFCFVWQNAYSQFLYPEEYKKSEYIPPSDPNKVIISPEVEKWMNEQLAKPSGEKKTVEMKTDVLGRVKPRDGKTVLGTKGVETKQVAEPKQKRLVRISEMHFPQIEIEPMHGRYEYNTETKDYDYYLNGKKLSLKEYENSMKKHFEKFDSQDKSKRKLSIPGVISNDELGWTALMTAEEISMLINNYKELAIGDYSEDETTATIASILSTIQLSTYAFPNNYKGNGIGVYVKESSCVGLGIDRIVNKNKYTASNSCASSYFADSLHHAQVVNVIQKSSPEAHIFGFGGSTDYYPPKNPSSYLPFPIEVGSHSYCKAAVTNNEYSQYDMEMDKYIYNNRVINFVAAGNSGKCGTTYDVSSPGKALNAITVGAVNPLTNKYADYSKWKNPDVGNEKPEIATYTDIDIGNGLGIFNGTSAATPLAAGFMATLLSQHPFCLRQPAAMKATLLTSEKIPIIDAASWDSDNYSGAARGVVNYSTIGWGTGGAVWDGDNSSFFDSNKEIVLTENNVQVNKRYKIAIAWLSDGKYVNDQRRVQQDLDLQVYQNGKIIKESSSEKNPFEVVDFVAQSSAPLKIVIKRFRNGDNGTNGGRVILGYNINFNH